MLHLLTCCIDLQQIKHSWTTHECEILAFSVFNLSWKVRAHTSLQLRGVMPKKHFNLQWELIWPFITDLLAVIDFYNWSRVRGRSGNDGDSYLQHYVGRPWEVEKDGGAPPSTGGGIALSENDSFPLILSMTFVKFCKTERNPNTEKVEDFDRFWYFSCFSLEVRQSSDACVDRCVFIPEQICLRTPTNMFHISWQIYAA